MGKRLDGGLDGGIEDARRELDGLRGRKSETLTAAELGRLGEILAAMYLDERGYSIEQLNYRCPDGEADIVAYDPEGEQMVLVEVKTRRGGPEGCFPEEAVDRRKRNRYRRIAAQYALDRFPVTSLRFDVIAISVTGSHEARLRHIFNLFGWEAP